MEGMWRIKFSICLPGFDNKLRNSAVEGLLIGACEILSSIGPSVGLH